MWFCGDHHGSFYWYLDKVFKRNCSIQLGDFGWGFPPTKNSRGEINKESEISRHPEMIPANPNHKFICGNHDDRNLVDSHPNYLGDYGYHEKSGIFYISGAFSIDADRRTMGVDWWEYEELSYIELHEMIQMFGDVKPLIVVSHDAPSIATMTMFPGHDKLSWPSKTRQAMDQCFEIWQPKRWYFGHWHITKQAQGTTRFMCVGIQQMVELPDVTWDRMDNDYL